MPFGSSNSATSRSQNLRGLTAEERVLFACTRKKLREEHLSALAQLCAEEIDWELVCTTAEEHSVAPLVHANLQQSPEVDAQLPETVRSRFEQHTLHSKLRVELADRRLSEILRFFREHAIDVMLLKGAAHARVLHAHPWDTTSADVDLLYRCSRNHLPKDVWESAIGFLYGKESPQQQLVKIESGWGEHHDVSMNGILPIDFAGLWSRASLIEVQGESAFVMCPEDLLIVACISSCRRRYFRLKLLYDVAEITHGWELNWPEVAERAQQWQCSAIVYTALRAADVSVGCRLPKTALAGLRVGPTRRWVVDGLSRRMSFSALAGFHSGRTIWGATFNRAVLLTYCSYSWRQVVQNLGQRLFSPHT